MASRKRRSKRSARKDVDPGVRVAVSINLPRWQKVVITLVSVFAALALVSGGIAFYGFITQDLESSAVINPPPEVEVKFSGEQVPEKIIEANLRAFLVAEDPPSREKFIYPDGAPETRLDYYGKRRIREMPLWKIEQMEKTRSIQGEIWLVVYRDLKKNLRAVSFQRHGDQYLLHWLAMKAYCEMPWEKFMVTKPRGPLVMRAYLTQYQGVLPLGAAKNGGHVFLIEDQAGLFSELAFMKYDAKGAADVARLEAGKSHPVTLELGYAQDSGDPHNKHLRIYALKHLRWQRMSADLQITE